MVSLALERLESLLQTRRLDQTLHRHDLDPHEQTRRASTGVAELDAVLGGGWRRGEVSEIVGRRGSGRTSVLLATLASATRRGEVAALIDTVDRFDPGTAAEAGVVLERLLWIRGPAVTPEAARPSLIDHAVGQGVRALDLVVRAGGFGLAVLDLADVSPRFLRALPLTTWLRLAHINEGRDTVCLLAGESPMGRSARGVSLALDATSQWTGLSPQSRRFAGLTIDARLAQARLTTQGASVQLHTGSPEPKAQSLGLRPEAWIEVP